MSTRSGFNLPHFCKLNLKKIAGWKYEERAKIVTLHVLSIKPCISVELEQKKNIYILYIYQIKYWRLFPLLSASTEVKDFLAAQFPEIFLRFSFDK